MDGDGHPQSDSPIGFDSPTGKAQLVVSVPPIHRGDGGLGGELLPLRLDNVGFDAGARRILRGITLELGAGPRTMIVGPNGAGKSVLLRLCHGLLEPTPRAEADLYRHRALMADFFLL